MRKKNIKIELPMYAEGKKQPDMSREREKNSILQSNTRGVCITIRNIKRTQNHTHTDTGYIRECSWVELQKCNKDGVKITICHRLSYDKSNEKLRSKTIKKTAKSLASIVVQSSERNWCQRECRVREKNVQYMKIPHEPKNVYTLLQYSRKVSEPQPNYHGSKSKPFIIGATIL